MPTEAALATLDPRAVVLAEVAARPLILCSRYTSRRVAGTSSVIVAPCPDGVSVSLFATTGYVAIRVIAAGMVERRLELPGEPLLKAAKRFQDAEFASVVAGPEGDLSIRFYGEKETLLCRCAETSCGPTDEAIESVMDEALESNPEEGTSMMSRSVLSGALRDLSPIAAFRVEQRNRGLSFHFSGEDFSGDLLVLGLNNPE
jgi:hypothetical protein